MELFFDTIYTEGNILATVIKLLILLLSFDFLLGFAGAIKSLKGSVS